MPETVVTVQNPDSRPAGKPGVENGNINNFFSWVEINYNYFKTIPGILKLAQLVSTKSHKDLYVLNRIYHRLKYFKEPFSDF